MPLLDVFHAVRDHTHDQRTAYQANTQKPLLRFGEVFLRTWDLGFTAFGGPAVHFQILYQRFVEGRGGKAPWIDEQTYQELFGICQALPGPGSTKMIFCIALIHAGFLPAVLVFLIWSLPGAIGMYGLSLGVQRMNEILPNIVYALLSGLNASTVGIIALAAVQLAEKAIKDPLSRILVIFGACAGLCYNALWYFPTLIVIGGLATLAWDVFLRQQVGKLRAQLRRKKTTAAEPSAEEHIALETLPEESTSSAIQRRHPSSKADAPTTANASQPEASPSLNECRPGESSTEADPVADTSTHGLSVKWGISIFVVFIASFISILIVRGALHYPPLALDLFANMYLAGTIIFGGGPVVIPLLREYVVQPGWVSPRDFLIGLAIIQAFPGPNFNFGVFLGALALAPSKLPTVLGAFLGFVGIFLPGLTVAVAFQSVWRVLRTKASVVALIRGINATAVGLVFTAVYRLWEIGFLTPEATQGQSLALEPWWVVVAALSYAESAWFNVPPAAAIVIGGILGLCWFGAVG